MRARRSRGLALVPALVGLAALIVLALLRAPVHAQGTPPPQAEPQPFIEPSEMRHAAAPEAFAKANPHDHGRWTTLPEKMPINPVHVALMHTGRVLVIAGSGNDEKNSDFEAAVWDPKGATIRTFKIAWDMFCNGMVVLPDGRPLVMGGTLSYDTPPPPNKPFYGEPRTAFFDPKTERFTDGKNMSGGRWYPTGTVLGNGSVLLYSGLNDTHGNINTTVQIGNGAAWSNGDDVSFNVPLYPREHLLPDGKVFESGENINSQLYDPAKKRFTPSGATTNWGNNRFYGTSVLLPLTPANSWKPTVMILGGGYRTVTDTTELIDLSVPSPKWVYGPKMIKPRVQLNATLLPDGKLLVSGGSTVDENESTAVKDAQLYDPESNSFSSASTMAFPRVYHSNTLLLPDATVVAVGGNPVRRDYRPEIEIYSPPYLFNADGTPAKRPVITHVAPATIAYGAHLRIRTPDESAIRSVVLVRAGAVTHAFDMDQRLVGLSFAAAGAGALSAQAPANGNLAPPGYYLLFIVNAQGTPSVGQFVHLGAPARRKR